MVTKLTKDNFESTVSSGVVLCDFFADWCRPCQMLSPVLEKIAADYEGRAIIGKVDTDESFDVAKQYGISALPTLLLFKGGEVVQTLRGLRSETELRELLDTTING